MARHADKQKRPIQVARLHHACPLVVAAVSECRSIDDLRKLGAMSYFGSPVYFIPPYEYYNSDQTRWSREMNVLLFNFTPGSGSNRDWAPEGHKSFVPSQKIADDILAFERKDPHGLNGFLLLLHLGSQRTDKMHVTLEPLVKELKSRGYKFVKVDEMLRKHFAFFGSTSSTLLRAGRALRRKSFSSSTGTRVPSR